MAKKDRKDSSKQTPTYTSSGWSSSASGKGTGSKGAGGSRVPRAPSPVTAKVTPIKVSPTRPQAHQGSSGPSMASGRSGAGTVTTPSKPNPAPAKPGVVAPDPVRSGRVSRLKIQVTTRQLERRGIGVSTVPKARTEDSKVVRGKVSPPDKAGDAKRRGAQPRKSDPAPDKQRDRGKGKTPEPAKRSDPRDARTVCKDRPRDNKPKGGGGSGKSLADALCAKILGYVSFARLVGGAFVLPPRGGFFCFVAGLVTVREVARLAGGV